MLAYALFGGAGQCEAAQCRTSRTSSFCAASGPRTRIENASLFCYSTWNVMAKSRDLMAPDTEPTDEELALVMREARELAGRRRAVADAWIAARLEEATRFGRENTRAFRTRDER